MDIFYDDLIIINLYDTQLLYTFICYTMGLEIVFEVLFWYICVLIRFFSKYSSNNFDLISTLKKYLMKMQSQKMFNPYCPIITSMGSKFIWIYCP